MSMRMRMSLKTLAIATSTFACAALLSFGWSPQGSVSLSIDKAQAATRVVVRPYLHGPYSVLDGSLPWYAVRAYYAGGPWCARGGVYGTAGWGLGVTIAATAAGLTTQRVTALFARPAP